MVVVAATTDARARASRAEPRPLGATVLGALLSAALGTAHAAPGTAAQGSEQIDPLSPFVRVVPQLGRFRTESVDVDLLVTYAQPFRNVGPGREAQLGGPQVIDGQVLPSRNVYARDLSGTLVWKLPERLPGGWYADVVGITRVRNLDVTLEGRSATRQFSMELAVWRRLGLATAELGGGYRWRPAATGFEGRRGDFQYAGVILRPRPSMRVELFLDRAADQLDGLGAQKIASMAVDHRIDRVTRVQGYLQVRSGLLPGIRSAEFGLAMSQRF